MSDTLDVTEDNFDREVIQASQSVPVLADFWAQWCQPCRMLAPVLEQLASENADNLKIVRIDTDENPQLAARLGIRGLPTVKLFRHGEVVDEFSGVQPLATVRTFIQPYLPRDSDARREQAAALAADGDTEQAITVLMRACESDPENYRLYPNLIELFIGVGRNDEAERIIKSLPANVQQQDDMVRLKAKLAFARTAEKAPAPEVLEESIKRDPDDLDARYQLGAVKVIQGEYETAMENLLAIIHRDRDFGDDAGRRALIEVFNLLDNQGPLVKKYRGLLASALN